MSKLTKGEKDGIRLVADLFVIRELKANVLSKNAHLVPHLGTIEENLSKAVPKMFAAEAELQKQIKEVRGQWLSHLIS